VKNFDYLVCSIDVGVTNFISSHLSDSKIHTTRGLAEGNLTKISVVKPYLSGHMDLNAGRR
jgi:hypothetical protein